MRLGAAIVISCFLAACGGVADGGGNGGGGGGDGGGDGGGGGTRRSDGSIGAACSGDGDCGMNLGCDTSAPGGYCTRTCTTPDCGAGNFCYATQNGGGVCLDGCASNADCGAGYTCQGEAGSTVCYVAPGGGGGGGCLAADQIVGAWSPGCGGSGCEQLVFSADGTLRYDYWNAASGNTETFGSWQFSCPNLTVSLTSGYWAPDTWSFTVTASQIVKNGTEAWAKCDGNCM